jgi:uncharacterized protein (TIGR02246 family)
MTKTRVLYAAVVALVGFWMPLGQGAKHLAASTMAATDLQGIKKLHDQDVAATLSGDPQALAELFTEDAVLLEPDAAAVIGKQAILAENKKEKAEHPAAKVLTYKPDIQDTKVVDGWAFEWAYFDSSFRESEKGEVKSFRPKVYG